LLLLTSPFSSSYAQYLHKDRISIKSGVALNGEITENIKSKYLIIKTEEYGFVKVKYSDVKYVLRKPDLNDPFYKIGAHQYFSAGVGYGAEYAGIGLRVQLRAGRKIGFAHFIGIGAFDVERNHLGVYQNNSYSHSIDQRTYKAFNISTGIKFYPYTYFYFGGGIQLNFPDITDSDGFLFIGIDLPINKYIILNTSIGYFSNQHFVSPTHNLMINLGINYKLTTNPVNTEKKPK